MKLRRGRATGLPQPWDRPLAIIRTYNVCLNGDALGANHHAGRSAL